MFAIELSDSTSEPGCMREETDGSVPKRVEYLSPRDPWNLIHRKHVQLCVPSREGVDGRLVLHGVQERNQGAPLLEVVDLGPERRWADFEQDV